MPEARAADRDHDPTRPTGAAPHPARLVRPCALNERRYGEVRLDRVNELRGQASRIFGIRSVYCTHLFYFGSYLVVCDVYVTFLFCFNLGPFGPFGPLQDREG